MKKQLIHIFWHTIRTSFHVLAVNKLFSEERLQSFTFVEFKYRNT